MYRHRIRLQLFLHCVSHQTLDDAKPVYTEEELQRFEAELRDKEAELGRRAESLRQEQEILKERGKALEAQKREYQQVSMEPWSHAPFSSSLVCTYSNHIQVRRTTIMLLT